MAIERDVALNILADLSKYEAEFRKLPGMTEKQAAKAAERFAKAMATGNRRTIKDGQKAAKKFGSIWTVAAGNALAAMWVDVGKRAGSALAGMGQEVADLRNDLADMSARTGVSAETLNGLRLAAEGSGQDLATMGEVLNPLAKKIADASRGTGEAKAAFDRLGVAVVNSSGDLRTADEVLFELTTKLNAIDDPTLRASEATAAFGEAGGKLMQSLSGKELEEFVSLARDFGVDMGPKAMEAAAQWQRSVAVLGMTFDGFKADMIDAFDVHEHMANFTVGLAFVSKSIKMMAENSDVQISTWSKAMAIGFESVALDALTWSRDMARTLAEWAPAWSPTSMGWTALADRIDQEIMGISDVLPRMIHDHRKEVEKLTPEWAAVEEATRKVWENLQGAKAAGGSRAAAVDADGGGTGGGAVSQLEAAAKLAAQIRERELTDIEKLMAARDKERVQLETMADRYRELFDQAGLTGAQEVYWANEIAAAFAAAADEARAADDALTAKAVENAKQRADARKAEAQFWRRSTIDMVDSVSGAAFDIMAINAELAAANAENAKEAALKLWKMQRGQGIAQVAVSTIIGIARALELGWPAAIAGMAAAGAAGAAQMAAILSVPPPTAHAGLFGVNEDEELRRIQRREVVVPTSTVEANGGPEGVRARLAGRSRSPAVSATLELDGEAIELITRSTSARLPPRGNMGQRWR